MMKDPPTLRIMHGDEEAFELVFRKYYLSLCGFANKFLNDQTAAKDIVQKTLTKIWEGRADIDPNN